MTVFITLTTTGADTGPLFNLYSDIDGFTSAFETGVSKMDLLIGYASSLVPNGTTIIRVMSQGVCTNYVDINLVLTTTTTTTIPNPAESTLTFDSYESGVFRFTLSNPIPSTAVVINSAQVYGGYSNDCQEDESDLITITNPLTILPGDSDGTQAGLTPFGCSIGSYHKVNSIEVAGWGPCTNGDIIPIDGVSVTIVIDELTCVNPYICTLYTQWEAQYDNSPSACLATPVTVYTVFGQTITTGNVVYTDSGLTTPLSGYTIIVDPVTNALYNINSTTGLIGSFIAFCV